MPFRSWYVSAQEALEEKKHVEWQFCGHSHDFHVMFSCQRGLCGSDIIHSLRLELLHAFVEPCDFLSWTVLFNALIGENVGLPTLAPPQVETLWSPQKLGMLPLSPNFSLILRSASPIQHSARLVPPRTCCCRG